MQLKYPWMMKRHVWLVFPCKKNKFCQLIWRRNESKKSSLFGSELSRIQNFHYRYLSFLLRYKK